MTLPMLQIYLFVFSSIFYNCNSQIYDNPRSERPYIPNPNYSNYPTDSDPTRDSNYPRNNFNQNDPNYTPDPNFPYNNDLNYNSRNPEDIPRNPYSNRDDSLNRDYGNKNEYPDNPDPFNRDLYGNRNDLNQDYDPKPTWVDNKLGYEGRAPPIEQSSVIISEALVFFSFYF